MKLTFQIVFLIFALSSYCQSGLTDEQYKRSGAAKIFSAKTVQTAENLALADVKAKTPILFIQGGIAAVRYPTDDPFQKLYGIYYHDFGCVGIDATIAGAYNTIVFQYLDATYGTKWRAKIRKDVIGLEEFRMK